MELDEWKYCEEHKLTLLIFKKYNMRVMVEVKPILGSMLPATDEERAMVERIARFVEAQIIAYSIFGLEKFTILMARMDDKEFCLPAGRVGVGKYLLPVKYTLERVTGKRAKYDPKEKQMEFEVGGQKGVMKGELIEAANKCFPIPEEERLVTNWEAIQKLLGLRNVKDIRFE